MDQDQSDKKTWQATKKAAEVTYQKKRAGCLDDLNQIDQEELANKKKKKRDQQEWLSSVYDSQVIEKANINIEDQNLNKKITKDYEDALMREELARWKKAFTISNSALDPPKVPVSNMDFEGGAVKDVLEKKFGSVETVQYKEFKELEADQDDRLKKFYNDSI